MKNKLFVWICMGLFTAPLSYAQGEYNNSYDDHKGSHADHKGSHSDHSMPSSAMEEGEVSYYTCGMHPSVKISVEHYKNGDTKCPICFMPLTSVKIGGMDETSFGENVMSKVEIKARELKLAGVQTEVVQKRQLFKEIRAVGTVAYDPEMAIAQDEFISAMQSMEKAKEGAVQEIIDRSESLVESSRRKLLLLGLSEEQITGLEKTKEVHTNLILAGEKMWIYGDVYEYELPWVKKGSFIKAKPIGLAGKEFFGEVVSINPIIDPRTRSVRFRALIDNPGSQLKSEMYVDVEIMSIYTNLEGEEDVVALPKSALLDTGRRKIVWVDKGNGQFEGRRIEIGPEAIDHSENPRRFYPVLKGIKEGEKVVTKGNFLIDSQSQITGIAASAYGGALGDDEKNKPNGMPAEHMH